LPVKRWTMREAATVFFGLGAHLGSARSQNGKGHVLGHVQDLGWPRTIPMSASTRRMNGKPSHRLL